MNSGVAVIGAGYWGKNLVRNFEELGVLRAVCEASEERRAYLKEQYKGQGLYVTGDLDAVVRDPEINGVVIATPAVSHFDTAYRALESGKHVFVEKPLSLRVADGRRLCELAEKRGQVLMVGHLLHYHPAVVTMKRLIGEGRLGRLHFLFSHRLNLGKLRKEENVMWSFAPHDVSLISWIAGGLPEKVMASGTATLRPGIFDTVNSQLCYKGDLKAGIFVSWLHPFKEQRLVVAGEKGMLVFDDTSPDRKLVLYRDPVIWNGSEPVVNRDGGTGLDYGTEEPLRNECRAFLLAMEEGKVPETDGWEGLRTLQVLSALQHSLERGGEWCRVREQEPDFFAHESAVIDRPCRIGAGTRIWHFSHIMKDARIGEGCNIGQNVVIAPGVMLGRNVKVQNNVSIYSGVVCEDDVFLGPSMVFTNVRNPRSHISRRGQYDQTIVGKGATIGANATIVCGVEIGSHAMVGAGAVVTKDVPPHALVVGNPARQAGWVCKCGNRIEPGDACSECGYILDETSRC